MNPRDIHSLEGLMISREAVERHVDTLSIVIIDGVYMKVFRANKNVYMGQHAHTYDHGTLVASGALRVFIEGKELGDFGPGDIVPIQANRKHLLLALEDNTIAVCIHNTHGADEPSVSEEVTPCQ